jgi:hypothetical protein
MASVPPLLERPVAEQARNAARHFADSGDLGIGQVGKAARILWAIRRPSARLAACRPSGAAGRTAGALPSDVHLVVAFVGGDGAFQPGALPVDEPV